MPADPYSLSTAPLQHTLLAQRQLQPSIPKSRHFVTKSRMPAEPCS